MKVRMLNTNSQKLQSNINELHRWPRSIGTFIIRVFDINNSPTDLEFNSESILEISHTNVSLAGWGNAYNDDAEGNMICTMVGPRGYVDLDESDDVPAYSSGWSFNPILPGLYDLMKNDPRFEI